MRKVFVDSVAWIAVLNTDDGLHVRAKEVRTRLRRQRSLLFTTEFVLLEVADALAAPALRMKTVAFFQTLRETPYLQIVPASQSLFNDGLTLYGGRADKEWSLTDCTSFVVMNQGGITDAFTSDHHFEQAGFVKLL